MSSLLCGVSRVKFLCVEMHEKGEGIVCGLFHWDDVNNMNEEFSKCTSLYIATTKYYMDVQYSTWYGQQWNRAFLFFYDHLPRKTYPSDPDFAPRSKNAQNSSKYRKPQNCQITSRNGIYVTRQTERRWSEVLTLAGCWVVVFCTQFSMSPWRTPPFSATDAHQTTTKPSNNPPKY